jgi:anti-sigma-D factor RsdA-like protein
MTMPDFGRWTSNGGDPSLNEINRTDRFIDALAFEQPVYSTDPGEAELAQVLAGWRDEVRDAPVRAVVTPRDAVIALDRAAATRKRRRMSTAVLGSVAAAVLCLGGFGAVVADAGPGDPLYGLRTMLFGEQQAPRDDAVQLASQQLAEVQQLIDQGQWDAAQDKLQTLTTTVATVNDVEQKQELVTQWQELTVKVESQDADATVPPNVPPPTFPDLPAVVLDTTTSTTTSSETTAPSSETTTPSTPLPTPSPSPPLPTPTPSTPLPTPTPTTPLPTPTPATPLPTPTPTTPLPTPTPATPLPTPTPTTYSPLPTPTTYSPTPTPTPTPLPTPTTRIPLPTPLPTPSEVEEEPATTEPPILEAPAPRTVIPTTTIVLPEPPDEPR